MLRRTKPTHWFYKSGVSVRDYRRGVLHAAKDRFLAKKITDANFEYESVVKVAIGRSGLPPARVTSVPDERWWKKLCKALQEKPKSHHGAEMLHHRVTMALGNRLLVDHQLATHAAEIQQQNIADPVFVVGLPRSNGHMATHIFHRSGLVQGYRSCDTLFPGVPNEQERLRLAKQELKGLYWTHPYMETLRQQTPDRLDDDIALQLMTPYSLAWGLLHGMEDYLYECIHEDQQGTYNLEKEVLKLFQFYKSCGQFATGVTREVTEMTNPLNMIQDGTRTELGRLPWVVHSPMAICHMHCLCAAFDDARIVWVHRSLDQCVPSMCSALAIHQSQYTGLRPTESGLGNAAEIVLGLFGSASKNATEYMATFPYARQVHWLNRDVQRSGTRLFEKTVREFGLGEDGEVDFFRRRQAIDGMVEFTQYFRPKHEYDMEDFALQPGHLTQHFDVYSDQFPQFAQEPRFGLHIQDYSPMSGILDQNRWAMDKALDDRQTSLEMMPLGGNYGAESAMVRAEDYNRSNLFRRKKEMKTMTVDEREVAMRIGQGS